MSGRGAELARFADARAEEFEWDLSPDGRQALLHVPFTNEVTLFPMKPGGRRSLKVKEGMHLRNVTWTAEGRGFFAANSLATGAQLIHVDLQANTKVLWTVNGRDVFLMGKESPDGRHVAIQASAGNSNLWMAENF